MSMIHYLLIRLYRSIRYHYLFIMMVVCATCYIFPISRLHTPSLSLSMVLPKDLELSILPFDAHSIRHIQQTTIFQIYRTQIMDTKIDWSLYSYAFYATDSDQLCSILINVKQLKAFKSEASIQLLYTPDILVPIEQLSKPISENDSVDIKQLKILTKLNVKIHSLPNISSPHPNKDSKYWIHSFTKLYVFKLVQFKRIVYLDSDSIILKSLDELFFIPPAILATTLDYISPLNFKSLVNIDGVVPSPLERSLLISDLYDNYIEAESNFDEDWAFKLYNKLPTMKLALDLVSNLRLASYLMVVTPSVPVFEHLLKSIQLKRPGDYDMEIINRAFNMKDTIDSNYFPYKEDSNIPLLLILPHNPYALLSGEFRHSTVEHMSYLADPNDFGFLNYKYPKLKELEKKLKLDYSDEDDAQILYPEIPYWSWEWNFEYARYGWNPQHIKDTAYLMHWSDYPIPKPWNIDENELEGWLDRFGTEAVVKCHKALADDESQSEKQCDNSIDIWKNSYEEYQKLVKQTCEVL